MTDDQQLDRVDKLRESANEAARHVRTVYLVFLLVGIYIATLIGSTTDEQLLRGGVLTLPLVNLGLPIKGFYIVAPWLFFILHFNLLVQFYFLSRKLHDFDRGIEGLPSGILKREWRGLLFPLPFGHMLAGKQHGSLIHVLLKIMVWLTVIVLPVGLLAWIQVGFLPYHSESITWLHRGSVAVDLALVWILWPRIMDRDGRWRDWWARVRGRAASLASVLIVGIGGTGLAVVFCGWVAVAPGEAIEWPAWPEFRDLLVHRNLVLRQRTLVSETPPPELLAEYERNGKGVEAAWLKYAQGLDLQDRDLRRAVFFNSKLTHANLRRALLEGADFDGAWLQRADLVEAEMQDAFLGGAHLQFADLGKAQLQDADLSGAWLQGANLAEAQLQGADLSEARLQGANLSEAQLQGAVLRGAELQDADLSGAWLQDADLADAQLQGANLRWARLQGADLEEAQLQGANLRYARLQGADLFLARLQGADLALAKLQGASLFRAQLQGANLWRAQLQGAGLSQAQLQGANLRSAELQGANLSHAQLQGADLRYAFLGGSDLRQTEFRLSDLHDVNFDALEDKEWDELVALIRGTVPEGYQQKDALDRLNAAREQGTQFDKLDPAQASGAIYEKEGHFRDWPEPPDEEGYDSDLAPELARFACGDEFVARGMARRVVYLHAAEMVFEKDRYLYPLLARKLLAEECAAGQQLPEEVRTELQEIARLAATPVE